MRPTSDRAFELLDGWIALPTISIQMLGPPTDELTETVTNRNESQ